MLAERDACSRVSKGLEGAFLWSASRLVDLSYRAEMVGEMRDAAEHAPQLELGGFARRVQGCEPSLRFIAEAVANLLPLNVVDSRHFPRLIPLRVGEGVAAVGRPLVHERQPETQVLHVCGD